MTAGFVINALAQKFTAPEYAFLTEVKVLRSMGTGNVLDRLIQAKGQLQSLCRSRYRGYPCNKQIHTEGTLHTDGLPDGCSWQTAQEDQPQL